MLKSGKFQLKVENFHKQTSHKGKFTFKNH